VKNWRERIVWEKGKVPRTCYSEFKGMQIDYFHPSKPSKLDNRIKKLQFGK